MIKLYKETTNLPEDTDLGNYLVSEDWGVFFHANHGAPTSGTPPYRGIPLPWDTLHEAQKLYASKKFEEAELLLMAALIRGE